LTLVDLEGLGQPVRSAILATTGLLVGIKAYSYAQCRSVNPMLVHLYKLQPRMYRHILIRTELTRFNFWLINQWASRASLLVIVDAYVSVVTQATDAVGRCLL